MKIEDNEKIIILLDEEFGEFVVFDLENNDLMDVFAILPVDRK